MRLLLLQLGQQIGFVVDLPGSSAAEKQPVIWREHPEAPFPSYVFYISASAVIGKILSGRAFPAEQSIIVHPGSRAGLIAYKLRSDPRLSQKAGEGWRFMKFRQLRRLVESGRVTHDNFDEQLALDALTYQGAQMPLF